MSYWRLASGIEVDFVLGDAAIAIEVKSVTTLAKQHLNGLGAFAEEHPEGQRRILVCLEPRRRKLESGIEVMPVNTFLRELWAGRIL
jgi:predicted AAA+ superfamily ATPase